ncbi:MAG: helix-turn-helix domain-containing protein [Patescibacteria group bacterium]
MIKSAEKTLKTLGWKIQKLRKKKKMSQEEFAHRLGISRTYMGYIEQGRESPSLKLLMKIARRFSMRVENLFHR